VRQSVVVNGRRLVAAGALAGAFVVALAGCAAGAPHYSSDETRACLADQPGAQVVDAVDFVASTAPAGAFTVRLADNQVTISFGNNADEADRIAQAYRRFRGKNIGIDDVLRPDGNAVLLWKAHPENDELAIVNDCLT
jgi:hypothetical protein